MKYSGIGGQAVIEGIMMKNKDEYATAVRTPSGKIEVKKETLGNTVNYLKENLEIIMQFHNSDIVGIILPDKISFKVTSTEQAVKGNTSSGAMKDAIIETGLNVKVPIFISEGEEIIVSTEDGKYVSRA